VAVRRVILDIGTHKTGSTSRQEFLQDHAGQLREFGIEFYEGSILPSNHVDLHMCCMDDDRLSPIKLEQGKKFNRRELFERTADRIASYLQHKDWSTLVFSAEGLSYLIDDSELERLAELFPDVEVDVVVYLRDKGDFLASYKRQLARMGIEPSLDRASFAYVGEDSWLLDYERFSRVFGGQFGAGNVTAYDYDDALVRHGCIVTHFTSEVLGVELGAEGLGRYWLNTSAAQRMAAWHRWIDKVRPRTH
jgi:hypothetical protein